LRADPNAALEFLQLVHPRGPWVLVAIKPDARDDPDGIVAETFHPASYHRASAWIAEHNGRGWGVYYHVNRVARPTSKKAERVDIALAPFLHVDSDPRLQDEDCSPEEWFAKEQARILAKFESPPGGIPVPTAVVDSGGGCNAVWLLEDPVDICGDLAKAEAHARYNLTLERAFEGDHCHNVDRVLRLPGTVNWPNEKKRERGRVPTMSKLVWWRPENVYPLARFTAAPPPAATVDEARGAIRGGGAPALAISGNVAHLGDVSQLARICRHGVEIPADLPAIIAEGRDPTNPNRFSGDRSRAVYYVCCELVRLGASDDDIYGVITDPDLGISAHVLDAGSGARNRAERQIRRARENAINPWIRELNDKHAVIGNYGGKCMIVEEVHDEILGRTRLEAQSYESFCQRYLPHTTKLKVHDKKGNLVEKDVPVAPFWFGHKLRRFYERVVFAPGKESPGNYNLWQGFAVDPVPGDAHVQWVAHVRDVVCAGDTKTFEYVWKWMARAVQRPWEPGQVALILRSPGQGTGKGTFAKWFGALFGRHYSHFSDPKQVTGNFNAALGGSVVVFVDEAFFAGDPRNSDAMKRLITEQTITVERKFVDATETLNCLHFIIASNHDWVVKIELDDRRYVFLDVSEHKKGDRAYWKAIDTAMRPVKEGGGNGLAHLLYALQTTDISDFDVTAFPKTAGHRDQRIRSMSPDEQWWFHKLSEGVLLPGATWTSTITKAHLLEDYYADMQRQRVTRPSTPTTLYKFLHRVCPPGWPKQARLRVADRGDPHPAPKSTAMPTYQFPELATCRAHWEANFGGAVEWPDEAADDDPPMRQASAF